MRFLRRLWCRWVRSDLWAWRRLREARWLCRALRRDNEALRLRVRQLEAERAAMGQADYWYRRWDELFEYTIKSVRQSGSVNNITGSVLLVELDKPVNLALFNSGSSVPTESITGAQFRTCRYIVWKHVPDETNVMLRYNPKDSTLVENGLLFPEYIDPIVRDNAGNVVKALKQQNLIQ